MKLISKICVCGLLAMISMHAVAQEEELPVVEQNTDAELLDAAAKRSAAVAAILDSPRETPQSQLSAVLTLIDLGEEEVAALLWKSLAEAAVEEAAAASLAEHFGTARLMKLARLEPLSEEDPSQTFIGAREFVQQCLDAAAKKARDPQRLAALVEQLNDPAAEVRKAARVDLAATGVEGARACLEALAQAEEEPIRANLMLALTSLKPVAEPLLIAALVDGEGHFRRDVAELCGFLQIDQALPFLAALASGADNNSEVLAAATTALSKLGHTVPNDAEARILLVREIKRLESGAKTGWDQETTETPWWSWNPSPENSFKSSVVASENIAVLKANRLAGFLLQCGDATPKQRQLATVYQLESAALRSEEISKQLATSDDTNLSDLLAAALQRNFLGAAQYCIAKLGEAADSNVLLSGTGRPSPLASGLAYGNRAIRFAALEAIMKINPERSFAGASRVPKVLWEFAAGAGPSQVVAASSVVSRADDWAAQMRERGYDATPANSGRAALQVALNSPRLELVLLDSDLDLPNLREVVYQLRSHERTTRLPIAVLSGLPNLEYSRRVAAADAKLVAIARPHNEQAMQDIVDTLKQLSDPVATSEHRTEQAAKAIRWIGSLLDRGHPYDEMLRQADVLKQTVHTPGLVESSLQALAVTGTAGSQQALIDYASQQVHPIETRRLAAAAFATSVERFGKQLRQLEIERQYQRYNDSETADAETQQVLGQILDVLEGKAAEASNANLRLNP